MSIPLTSNETNTPLADGGYVHAYDEQTPFGLVLQTQKYDASGAPVGPLSFVPLGQALGIGYSGQYAIGAEPNGGYVELLNALPPRTTGLGVIQVMGPDGLAAGALSLAHGAPSSLTMGSTGDFVVAGIVEPRTGVQAPTVTLFNSSGGALSDQIVMAGPISSITPASNGVMLVNWDDVSAIRTLTLDPATASGLTPPAAPTAEVLDASGQVIGSTPTTDLFPTLRVHVQQPGEVLLVFPSVSPKALGGGVPVTADDVARGYIDIPLSAPPATADITAATGYVRLADANGLGSAFVSFVVPEAADPQAGQRFDGAYQDNLIGTGADDVFYAAVQGSETWRGGPGDDTFVFNALPWTPDRITDFTVGQDRLYMRSIFPNLAGSDPIAAGYVTLIADGQGGTDVLVNPDGHATAANPWPTFVVDLTNVSPVGLSAKDLFGGPPSPPPPPPPPPPSGGVVLQGQADGSHLTGGTGDDTLVGGTGPDVMTGDGGGDHFTFQFLPWVAADITDFTHGADKLDLSGLLAGAHYTGNDPIADGYVKFIDNGQGGTWLYFDSDGKGSADPWGTYVATIDHMAANTFTDADLTTGGVSPPPAGGMTLQGQAGGSNLVGAAGADTLIGGTGPDTMTGDGGADHFVWSQLPWVAGAITDFTHGVDRIDLSGLLAGVHYTGPDPIADGYVKLLDDGQGDTWLYFDTDGHGSADPWGTFVATIRGVTPAGLASSDFIFSA